MRDWIEKHFEVIQIAEEPEYMFFEVDGKKKGIPVQTFLEHTKVLNEPSYEGLISLDDPFGWRDFYDVWKEQGILN